MFFMLNTGPDLRDEKPAGSCRLSNKASIIYWATKRIADDILILLLSLLLRLHGSNL